MRTQAQQIARKWIGGPLTVALAAFLLGSPAVAQSSESTPSKALLRVGQVEQVQGTAFLAKPHQVEAIPAVEQSPVYVQDLLFAQGDSNVWWHFPDLQTSPKDASLGADSYLKFLGYAQSDSGANMSTEVPQGIVRFITKLPNTDPASSFTVNSPTALAWALPGAEPADFVVEAYDKSTVKITVIWGLVAVKNVSEDLKVVRLLKSCQSVTVQRDQEPGPVTGVSSDTLRTLISLTTIPGTLPEDVPSCERSAEVYPPEEYPLIAPLVPPVVLITIPEIVIIPGDDPPGTDCPVCYQPQAGGCAPLACPQGMTFDAAAPGCCKCAQCHEVRDGQCLQIQCPANNEFSVTAPGCCRPCGRCEQLQANGQCGPIQCPEGGIYDPSSESCCTFMISGPPPKSSPPPAPQIGAPLRMVPFNPTGPRFPDGDPNGCSLRCPPGQRVDRIACRCIPSGGCNITCPEGQRLDRAACKCIRERICDRTCPPGQRLHRAACKCLPHMSHKDTVKRKTVKGDNVTKPHKTQWKPRVAPPLNHRNQKPMMRMNSGKRLSSCIECGAQPIETSNN
jgi:hypothetical protein